MLWNATAESQHNGWPSSQGTLPLGCGRHFIHHRTETRFSKWEKQLGNRCLCRSNNSHPQPLGAVVHLEVVRAQVRVEHRRQIIQPVLGLFVGNGAYVIRLVVLVRHNTMAQEQEGGEGEQYGSHQFHGTKVMDFPVSYCASGSVTGRFQPLPQPSAAGWDHKNKRRLWWGQLPNPVEIG